MQDVWLQGTQVHDISPLAREGLRVRFNDTESVDLNSLGGGGDDDDGGGGDGAGDDDDDDDSGGLDDDEDDARTAKLLSIVREGCILVMPTQ